MIFVLLFEVVDQGFLVVNRETGTESANEKLAEGAKAFVVFGLAVAL